MGQERLDIDLRQSFIQRGGGGGGGRLGSPPPPPPELCKHYDVIALKHEKMAVVLHTSDGKLGAVS